MGSPQELTCHGCGLTVQRGYPKCPRCKMPLPAATAPLAATTARSVQGGTSVASNSSLSLYLGLAAAAMLVAGVVFIASSRSGGEGEVAEETGEPVEEAEARPPDSPPAAKSAQSADLPSEGEEELRELERYSAMKRVEARLNGERLWASVSDGGDVVSVVSGACEEPEMKPALIQAAREEALQELGFQSVRCLARHGALVFEQSL